MADEERSSSRGSVLKLLKENEKLQGNNNIPILLERLANNRIEKLEPKLDLKHGFKYPEAEEILQLPPEDTKDILDELAKIGVLDKEFKDKLVKCPICDSLSVATRHHCPYCDSLQIDREKLIEHLVCGNIDMEAKYRKNDELICPKCHLPLRSKGIDYRRVGAWYDCQECKRRFDTPKIRHHCLDCGAIFTVREAELSDAYTYTMNKDAQAEFKRSHTLIKALKKALEEKDYKVLIPGIVEGESGNTHTFSLYASKGDDSIALEIEALNDYIDETEVMALVAKILDVKPKRPILMVSNIRDREKNLAKRYNIETIQGDTVEELVQKFNLLITPPQSHGSKADGEEDSKT